MKQEYNFKEIMDERFKDIKADKKIIEDIKQSYNHKRKNQLVKYSNGLLKVAGWILGIVCLVSGATYALENSEGFKTFIDEITLGQLSPYIQTINKVDKQGDIKLVVEQAVTDGYNSLLVFSLINEGEEPWVENVQAGSWKSTWVNRGSMEYGPPTLSDNGRKLTYYIETSSREKLSHDKLYKLIVDDLIVEEEVTEQVNIPFEDYIIESQDTPVVLRTDPEVTIEGLDFVEDGNVKLYGMETEGLAIYTRNKSKHFWTGTDNDYITGVVSEIKNIKNNETYKANGREFRHNSLFKGALGTTIFKGVSKEDLKDLTATEITYDKQTVLARDKWQVEFKLDKLADTRSLELDLEFTEGEEVLNITGAEFSIFGLTLVGEYGGRLSDPLQESLFEQIDTQLRMKDGATIELVAVAGAGGQGGFYKTFGCNEEGELAYFDIDNSEVEAIIINEEVIYLE